MEKFMPTAWGMAQIQIVNVTGSFQPHSTPENKTKQKLNAYVENVYC